MSEIGGGFARRVVCTVCVCVFAGLSSGGLEGAQIRRGVSSEVSAFRE